MRSKRMNCTQKHNILGVQVNRIDYDNAVACVIDAAEKQHALGLTALAVHGVMTGALNVEQRARLNALDIVAPDGQPVRWALNTLHGAQLPDRVYGPDLMLKVCENAAEHGLAVFLYGSRPTVLEKLQKSLQARFEGLEIAGIQPSRFRTLSADEKQNDIEHIQSSGARIVFVGLGCPRQETWVYEHLDDLQMPMLAVGAAFDFHAGLLAQAPVWMQKRGLEWLFRLIKEPGRLWKRYFYLNPAYITLVLLQWAGLYRMESKSLPLPDDEIRYG